MWIADAYQYLCEFNHVSVAVRLLLAMIVGGMIGIERGKQGRAAGMRTHILVCIGAALTVKTVYSTSSMTVTPVIVAPESPTRAVV